MDQNLQKKLAAEKAIDEEIKDGMIVGLGTGSTAKFAILKLAQKIKDGKLRNIYGIPTSKKTEELAVQLGIPLLSLNEIYKKEQITNYKLQTTEHPTPYNFQPIDITIDGADEVDENLNLIKGGGGALLREKVIAQASKKFVVVVDETKLSHKLGTKWFVPVEVLQFAVESEKKFLESISNGVVLRKNENDELFITDEGNIIIDVNFGEIENPKELSNRLNDRAGIVGHGIFLNDLVSYVYCSSKDGVKRIQRKDGRGEGRNDGKME